MTNRENLRKLMFMSYKEILEKFKYENVKTKSGKEITHKELRTAINLMIKKHPLCQWQSEKVKKKYYYIQYEAVLWLKNVYFNNYQSRFIDKDIEWFENRIEWYQSTLSRSNIKFIPFSIEYKLMSKKELEIFFCKSESCIKNAIREVEEKTKIQRQNIDGIVYLNQEQIVWLLKNKFKQKYLKLLEIYKMELTIKFKENGGYYNDYFGRN